MESLARVRRPHPPSHLPPSFYSWPPLPSQTTLKVQASSSWFSEAKSVWQSQDGWRKGGEGQTQRIESPFKSLAEMPSPGSPQKQLFDLTACAPGNLIPHPPIPPPPASRSTPGRCPDQLTQNPPCSDALGTSHFTQTPNMAEAVTTAMPS